MPPFDSFSSFDVEAARCREAGAKTCRKVDGDTPGDTPTTDADMVLLFDESVAKSFDVVAGEVRADDTASLVVCCKSIQES
jgi:hypothetical protein